MLKRIVPLVLVLFAVAVPAALADDAAPPAAAGAPGTAAKQEQRGQRIQQRIERFAARCGQGGKADPATCTQVATRVLARLQKLDGRIGARVAKITERCSAADAATKCKNADVRVQRLEALQAKVKTLTARVQAFLAGGASSSGAAAPSLDDLAGALAALEHQNP
jgi:hypothetical protein